MTIFQNISLGTNHSTNNHEKCRYMTIFTNLTMRNHEYNNLVIYP